MTASVPSRRPARRRHSVALAAAALVSVPALAACTAAATDEVYTPSQGVNNRDGRVDVLHALVVSDGKDGGRFIAGLSNNDQTEEDELTGITVAEGDAQVQLGDGETKIPAAGLLQLADEGSAEVQVKGVTQGGYVRLTLAFQSADSVTVNVPVVAAGDDFADVEVPGQVTPSESAAEEPTPSESESEGE